MSKLYLNESGHVVPSLCEELTCFRRARKVLHLPPTAAPATLYLLARAYADSDRPLRLAINGVEIAPLQPGPTSGYLWYQIPVEAAVLKPGPNTFELWTDATAMDAWSLGLEAGHEQPHSAVSDDAGASWRSARMGIPQCPARRVRLAPAPARRRGSRPRARGPGGPGPSPA